VDLVQRRVFNGSGPVNLNWRTFEALRLLIDAGGEVVHKEVLFERLWPGVTVEESSLTKCIGQLRKALSNGEGGEDYVETVPRIGYRLAVAPTPEVRTGPAPVRPSNRRRGWLWTVTACTAVLAAGGGWHFWRAYQVQDQAERIYEEGQRLRRINDPVSIRAAIEAFQSAAKLNPRKAIYYASLAETLGQVNSPASDIMDWGPMLQAAERSVALDPRCSGCQASLGFTLYSRFWDWPRAEIHLRAAL